MYYVLNQEKQKTIKRENTSFSDSETTLLEVSVKEDKCISKKKL